MSYRIKKILRETIEIVLENDFEILTGIIKECDVMSLQALFKKIKIQTIGSSEFICEFTPDFYQYKYTIKVPFKRELKLTTHILDWKPMPEIIETLTHESFTTDIQDYNFISVLNKPQHVINKIVALEKKFNHKGAQFLRFKTAAYINVNFDIYIVDGIKTYKIYDCSNHTSQFLSLNYNCHFTQYNEFWLPARDIYFVILDKKDSLFGAFSAGKITISVSAFV